MTLAIAVKKSGNGKVGEVAVTHAAQVSCPPDCPFYMHGCYAEYGTQKFTTRRLNRAAADATPLQVAKAEAWEIRRLKGDRLLRLHIVGDCPTEDCARIVSAAAAEYTSRYGQPVWTYTHAWRVVDREAWGDVSVLASCETPIDVSQAKLLGYATALVVNGFQRDTRHWLGNVDGLPCVEQTRGVTCEHCRLCTKDKYLIAAGLTILFDSHSQGEDMVNEALERRAA